MGQQRVGMKLRHWEAVVLWFTMASCFHSAVALRCWKCIAHDCETDPGKNYKATKVTCAEGQQCMKVRYQMFDNKTHYDSVIRTCSMSGCSTTPLTEFETCLKTNNNYMITGCALKSCCSDKDLCNSVGRTKLSFVSVLAILLSIVYSVE